MTKVQLAPIQACSFLWDEEPKASALINYLTSVVSEVREELRGKKPFRDASVRALEMFPGIVTEIGPALLSDDKVRRLMMEKPRFCLEVLKGHYELLAPKYEQYLTGAGEQIYLLLKWARERKVKLYHPEGFYRDTLLKDPFWGYLHARDAGNGAFLSQLAAFATAHRDEIPGAALIWLLMNPSEEPKRFGPLLSASPMYSYLASVLLFKRGLIVESARVQLMSPKWAFHFLLRDPKDHVAEQILQTSPEWAVEYVIVSDRWKDANFVKHYYNALKSDEQVPDNYIPRATLVRIFKAQTALGGLPSAKIG